MNKLKTVSISILAKLLHREASTHKKIKNIVLGIIGQNYGFIYSINTNSLVHYYIFI